MKTLKIIFLLIIPIFAQAQDFVSTYEADSMEVRYKIGKVKIFYTAEYTHRGDLNRFVLNGYGGLIYNLTQF